MATGDIGTPQWQISGTPEWQAETDLVHVSGKLQVALPPYFWLFFSSKEPSRLFCPIFETGLLKDFLDFF